MVQEWFEEHNNKGQTWPPNSPDLNPDESDPGGPQLITNMLRDLVESMPHWVRGTNTILGRWS